MKKIIKKSAKVSPAALVNTMALARVAGNVNTACSWLMYQPELPESAKKFIKD